MDVVRSFATGLSMVALVGCGGGGTESTGGRDTTTTSTATAASSETRTIDLDGLSVDVPRDWMAEPTEFEIPGFDEVPTGAVVSPDPAGWRESWTTTGAFLMVSASLAADIGTDVGGTAAMVALAEWHGGLDRTDCERAGAKVFETDDGDLNGFTTLWVDCGDVDATLLDIGAITDDGTVVVVAQASGVGDDDREVLEAVVGSLRLR